MRLVKRRNGVPFLLQVVDILQWPRIVKVLEGVVDVSMRRGQVVAGQQRQSARGSFLYRELQRLVIGIAQRRANKKSGP